MMKFLIQDELFFCKQQFLRYGTQGADVLTVEPLHELDMVGTLEGKMLQ